MNGLTNATRTLIRSIVIAAAVAALALSAAQRAGAEEYSPTVGAGVQASLCEAGGGEAETYGVTRTVADGVKSVQTRCKGGSLDGWDCFHGRQGSYCTDPKSRQEDPPATTDNAVEPTEGVETESELSVLTANVTAHVIAPTGGVEVATDEPLPAPATTDEVVAPTDGAEEPAADEPTILDAEPATNEPAVDEGADPAEEESGGMVEGGIADESVADEDDAGQDLPNNPAQDETTAPTEGDPAADPGAGTDGEGANETYVLEGENAEIVFFEEDDEQS